MTEITTKEQLIHMLKVSNQHVIDWFTAIPVENFFLRFGEAWSASDHVDHLIKSHKPIAMALKLPKVGLRAIYGKPGRASMSYENIGQTYRGEITKGAQASGRYLPDQGNPDSGTETRKMKLLELFSKASSDLTYVVDTWDEHELDQYLLPHPILGKLTIREMIFFTIDHNLRHASQEGD